MSSVDLTGSDGGAGLPPGSAPDRGWVLVADAIAGMNRTQNDAHRGQVWLLWGIFSSMLLNLAMLWLMEANETRRHEAQIEVMRGIMVQQNNSVTVEQRHGLFEMELLKNRKEKNSD